MHTVDQMGWAAALSTTWEIGRMRVAAFAMAAAAALPSWAQEITTCRAPAGRAYYHYAGGVPQSEAGWRDDKISDSAFTLTLTREGVDLLYTDTRRKPVSSTQDGALVRLVGRSETTVTVLVFYSGSGAVETYAFFQDLGRRHRFTMTQTRASGPVPKASLLVGECEPIRFDLLPK